MLPKKKSKEKLKKPHEKYQNLTQEEKEKNINVVVINIKTFLNIKNKDLLITEKKYLKFHTIAIQTTSKMFFILTKPQIYLGYNKPLHYKLSLLHQIQVYPSYKKVPIFKVVLATPDSRLCKL